jgi:hypothetical protein
LVKVPVQTFASRSIDWCLANHNFKLKLYEISCD